MSPRTAAVIPATALTAALAALGLAGPAASRPRAAAPAPPVMHESFTPLGCSGSPGNRTTLQEEGCAEQSILASDKRIDALNRQIFARLGTSSAKRDFVAGHSAWLTYRHRYCLSESDVFQGGTEAGVLDADCTADLNTAHVADLRRFLGDFGG